MNKRKIVFKAKVQTFYQGLNMRLQAIASDLAKMNAQDYVFDNKEDAPTEEEIKESIYRKVYRAELEKEAKAINELVAFDKYMTDAIELIKSKRQEK